MTISWCSTRKTVRAHDQASVLFAAPMSRLGQRERAISPVETAT
jgi:hypothetical protein